MPTGNDSRLETAHPRGTVGPSSCEYICNGGLHYDGRGEPFLSSDRQDGDLNELFKRSGNLASEGFISIRKSSSAGQYYVRVSRRQDVRWKRTAGTPATSGRKRRTGLWICHGGLPRRKYHDGGISLVASWPLHRDWSAIKVAGLGVMTYVLDEPGLSNQQTAMEWFSVLEEEGKPKKTEVEY
ncbi:uncharacterized protein STEHIDRAFT_107750 [Stereum hirsutum FP-91666 SS1]|uniref:uncharacterized protein n=1 Tax=Stereum hirsutum (strain FP-91666) TaxID=721885 RepID=UPI000440B48F|nr:uncharacterized protein STEHIDRAFT_107750 [Stereum hirsutum FP-91666 SS1]EIM91128.1 hypothetical protein STEHIDRAFT_107750 [Stereum hirsutum FP-91666 SS1]